MTDRDWLFGIYSVDFLSPEQAGLTDHPSSQSSYVVTPQFISGNYDWLIARPPSRLRYDTAASGNYRKFSDHVILM